MSANHLIYDLERVNTNLLNKQALSEKDNHLPYADKSDSSNPVYEIIPIDNLEAHIDDSLVNSDVMTPAVLSEKRPLSLEPSQR